MVKNNREYWQKREKEKLNKGIKDCNKLSKELQSQYKKAGKEIEKEINNLFVKNDGNRGKYPIGVNLYKRTNKYRAYCNIYDKKTKRYKNKHLGYFSSVEEAFKVYKEFKEEYIKQVANEVKEYIPKKLYDAMYKYEVEIND